MKDFLESILSSFCLQPSFVFSRKDLPTIKVFQLQVEKFVKSTGLELDFSNEVTEQGRYSPRFVDEIVDEIDVIEDKKDSIFREYHNTDLFRRIFSETSLTANAFQYDDEIYLLT